MKTVRDFADECLNTLVDLLTCPTYRAFRCWGCSHKPGCILTATIAYDMIIKGEI